MSENKMALIREASMQIEPVNIDGYNLHPQTAAMIMIQYDKLPLAHRMFMQRLPIPELVTFAMRLIMGEAEQDPNKNSGWVLGSLGQVPSTPLTVATAPH